MEPDKVASPVKKEERLKEMAATWGTVAVAYSGGVDSSYLADVAVEVLGKKVWLFIADTPSFPRSELSFALELARARGWQVEILNTHEFSCEAFLKNDAMRCYHCKGEIFSVMAARAQARHIAVLAHGETAEDILDSTRVGMRAAHEAGVQAPLADAGFTKADIRERSRARGLPTWAKPSFACLASRIPEGSPITREALDKIEQAEILLRELGCRQYRARHHGELCRIEVESEDMPLLLLEQNRQQLITALRKLGYRYVTLDLAGYKTGNMAK